MLHNSSFEVERDSFRDGGEVLVAIAALVTEGRIPGKINKSRGFFEGPHCPLTKNSSHLGHNCDTNENVCKEYDKVRSQVLSLWRKNVPLCVEVFLRAACSCEDNEFYHGSGLDSVEGNLLLEQWYFSVNHIRTSDATTPFNFNHLISAVRSQLYFSQISAWLSSQEESSTTTLTAANFKYRLAIPGETFARSKFSSTVSKHDFPSTDLGGGLTLNITLLSLPRTSTIPNMKCSKCEPVLNLLPNKIKPDQENLAQNLFDDRMHTMCTLKGKHRCEDYDDFDSNLKKECKFGKPKRVCHKSNSFVSSSDQNGCLEPSTSNNKPKLQLDIGKTEMQRFLNEKNHLLKKLELQPAEKRNSGPNLKQSMKPTKLDLELSQSEIKDVMSALRYQSNSVDNKKKFDLIKQQNKGVVLPNSVLRNRHSQNGENLQNDRQKSTNNRSENDVLGKGDSNAKCDEKCVHKLGHHSPGLLFGWEKAFESVSDNSICDKSCERSDIFNNKEKNNIYVDSNYCDSPVPKNKYKKMREISNVNFRNAYKGKARQRITFEDYSENGFKSLRNNENWNKNVESDIKSDQTSSQQIIEPKCQIEQKTSSVNYDKPNANTNIEIPSLVEQAKFRKSLDSAASMVFHSRTGLPLTSSPAPVRKGKCFGFDSSINSVSAIKSALFSGSLSTDDDSESDGSIVSPCSPDTYILPPREPPPAKYCRKGHAANLLGTFEESVLNGRLEPVSTVHGFTAELGASGSFVPRHLVVPVTVFFYTLGDNDKVSSPYLGHINLGKKGYNVPKMGTVQVTLFNPLGTVVKMFVILYDLSDMPPNSQTFIRQRTLYMPTNCKDKNLEWGPKWLRYLIHLRFMSSKSGRIYLHSDIRMIIFRKSDLDTATAHGMDMSYELRSFTHMPANPKYSPRK